MKSNVRQQLRKGKMRIHMRLGSSGGSVNDGRAILAQDRPAYEIADRTRAIAHGGIAAVHHLAVRSGLVDTIDRNLHLLKFHRPYHESDHVLNLAYNAMCGGRCLDDIELRRNDEAFLDALGAEAIPDPTTAGDFCRRFTRFDIQMLMDAINEVRIGMWRRAGVTSETARIDADGTLLATTGERKEAMALSYKGTWGYHPLVVSLANTAEPLFLANRSGNAASHAGAVPYFDRAVELCRRAGFDDVLLRGDTDFSRTTEFDRWTADGVRFVFSYDAFANLKERAGAIDDGTYRTLVRKARQVFGKRRARQPRHKEAFVDLKGYKNIKLRSEDVAEFTYRPVACKRDYRMVVVRKNLTVEHRKQGLLFDDIRYFFYVTNDDNLTAEQVVRESNQRCNQENLIEQLKNGVRALHAPVNEFNANWAYMVMTSLAWTLKAWMALSLPVRGRWSKRWLVDRERWLRMEFRNFVQTVVHVPAQVVRSGRRRILRLLAWRPELPVFFRFLDAL